MLELEPNPVKPLFRPEPPDPPPYHSPFETLPFEGPPTLSKGPADLAGRWLVVMTKSRREKSLARFCLVADIPYFLPYVRTRNINRSYSFNPRFPGIMFVCIPNPDLLQKIGGETGRSNDPLTLPAVADMLRDSRHVFGFLPVRDQPLLRKELNLLIPRSANPLDPAAGDGSGAGISDADLGRLAPDEDPSGSNINDYHGPDRKGCRRVRIIAGASAGLTGFVSAVEGVSRRSNKPSTVFINFSFANQTVPLEIPATYLEFVG